ncbi:hypothetical protein [Streptomyces sp. NPDC086182]|uniref:hypothetical protein n=1 Tax=Streptomyces sp. NPDC086182 TaxID=3155058 RepID=UPI0034164CBF
MTAPDPASPSPADEFATVLYLLYIRLAAGVIAERQNELAALIAQQEHLKGDRP